MIIFKNPGLVDTAALTTMGVNVKKGSSPIGIFGTGFKYAVSIVLRDGGSVVVYRGKKRLEFGRKKRIIRGEPFQLITINGKELGFTDRMGLNWQPWMAYREFWSNNRDEGGSVITCDSENDLPIDGKSTLICVSGKEIEQAHHNRQEIILQTAPTAVLPMLEIHPGPNKYIFYKGIRVAELPKTSKYTYSLMGHQMLTEDRTLLYPSLIGHSVARGIVQSTWTPFLFDILHKDTTTDFFEGNLPYSNIKDTAPSPQFMEVAEQLHQQKNLNAGALGLFKHYQDTMPGYVSPYIVELTEAESAVFDRAHALVDAVVPRGSFVGVKIQFKTKMDLYKSTAGKHTITLDHKLIEKGSKKLAQALLEGLAMQKGGSFSEQLTSLLLFQCFIPDELTEGYSPQSVAADDVPF